MAKPDTSWKHDRAIFLAERPNPKNLRIFRPDIASLHPYRIVVVHWNRERCPDCGHEIHRHTEAAFDIETNAVFCWNCAKRHVEQLLEAYAKAEAKKPPPDPDELAYIAYLESILPALHPYYDAPDDLYLDRPADPPEGDPA